MKKQRIIVDINKSSEDFFSHSSNNLKYISIIELIQYDNIMSDAEIDLNKLDDLRDELSYCALDVFDINEENYNNKSILKLREFLGNEKEVYDMQEFYYYKVAFKEQSEYERFIKCNTLQNKDLIKNY